MILYHGSDIAVEHPDVLHSKEHLDFGIGFYTTSVKFQAERWAMRKALLNKKEKGIVGFYELGDTSGLAVCDFGDDLFSWIDFVCLCRSGADCFLQYDIIKGKVADDKVIRVVDMYMRKLIPREKAIQDIRIYETYDQIAFVSQKAIDSALVFKGCYEVSV